MNKSLSKLLLIAGVTCSMVSVYASVDNSAADRAYASTQAIIKQKSKAGNNTNQTSQSFGVNAAPPVPDITGGVYTRKGQLPNVSYFIMPWEKQGWHPKVQILHNGNEITYHVNSNNPNYSEIMTAINNWNALGVIKLVPINGTAQINITDAKADLSSTITGETDVNSTWASDLTYATISSANIEFTPYYRTLNQAQQINVAEHELGHALGFAHENAKVNFEGYQYRFIMSAWGTAPDTTIKLGLFEKQTLQYYYANQLNGN